MIEYYFILSAVIGLFVLFAGMYEMHISQVTDDYPPVWKEVLIVSIVFLLIWPWALTKFLWEHMRS